MNIIMNLYYITRAKARRWIACLPVLIASLTASPVMSVPNLELDQTNFVGVFGSDYPVLDFMADLDDGDSGTTDYFFEWILSSRDATGNEVDFFITSGFNDFKSLPLDNSFGASLFPAAGDYTLHLDMTTFHQVGGLPGCGPNNGCVDSTKPFNVLGATDSMAVHLMLVPELPVPEPSILWLLSTGLLGLIGLAKLKVNA